MRTLRRRSGRDRATGAHIQRRAVVGSSVAGAAGNDKLNGEAGKDSINGDKGNDIINAGDDDDLVNDSGGVNTIDLGAGNDSVPKIYGTGVIYGGAGNDNVVAVGGALIYGEEGDDNLQSWWLDGGKGNDSLMGLMGNDEIHGGDGADLIRGFDGNDVLLGDDGNDAIFGGVGEDTLFGGNGDDNLYGTNGYADKHKDLGQNDDGFGQGGSDWFETNYRWDQADRNGEDRPVASQNSLGQDSSAGLYLSGTFISSATLASGAVSLNSLRVSNGSFDITNNALVKMGGGTLTLAGSTVTPTIITDAIGPAGWLSSGAYDQTTKKFVPPALAHKERIKATRVVLEIPRGWNLGNITAARDDIVWYQVWRDGATPPAPGSMTIGGKSFTPASLTISNPNAITTGQTLVVTQNVSIVSGGITSLLEPGNYVWNGTSFVDLSSPTSPPATNEPLYNVPTLAGTTAQAVESTPHLYDGVENGTYRYLGVKRGTILVSGDASTVSQCKWTPLNTPLLALPPNVDLRIAGVPRVYHMSLSYDSLPAGGPKVKAIGVDGGAIWLPSDGTEPYFSSGKN